MKCVDEGRIAISAVAVGMAQGVLERAAKYSKERVTFGKPICENQAIAFKLAEMATEIEVARVMLYHTAKLCDQGLPFAKEATMTKMYTSEMCVKICDMGLQIMGGYGLCNEYEVERHYRDAKLLTIGEGSAVWLSEDTSSRNIDQGKDDILWHVHICISVNSTLAMFIRHFPKQLQRQM